MLPKISVTMFVFETSRLQVRQLTLTDLPGFQALQGNAQVMQYTTGIPLSPEASAHELAEIMACYQRMGNETWVWAAVIKDGDFVGTCALFKNEWQENEIAYRLQETCWGAGYGQEIANGLIDYCLDELGLHSIVAQTVKDNLASVKILDHSRLSFLAETENIQKNWIERHYRYIAVSDR